MSCPAWEALVTLPEDAKAGDMIECCGRPYRLTFEYGAFAAEERWEGHVASKRLFSPPVCGPESTDRVRIAP